MPRYSIIVVCLNAGNDLSNTIEGLLRQTYKDFEIIIKDGGSQDGSINSVFFSNVQKIILAVRAFLYWVNQQRETVIDRLCVQM